MTDVAQTFVKMLPFVLAGVFLPTWTANVILLLGTDRPVANAEAFIAGNAFYRFLVGLAVLYIFGAEGVLRLAKAVPAIPPWVLWLVAAALIAPGAVLLARRSSAQVGGEPPRWMRTFESFPPWGSFVWGLISVASPGEQYIVLIAAVGVIAAARLPAWQSIALLAVAVALYQVMLELPVGIYVWKRERADAIFARFKAWLGCYGGRVAGGILVALGLLVALAAALR